MEKIKSYLLAGLITFIVIWFSVHSCQKQDIKQEARTVDSSSLFKQRIEAIQARGEAIKTKLHTDSLKTSLALQALKIENKNLRKKIKELRPDILVIADSMPIIRRWVDVGDSIDIVQTAEIDSLYKEKSRIWRSMNAIVFNRDEQIQLLTELVNHKEVISQDLRKKLRKERRKKTFFKVTTALGIVTALYLAIQD